jgi:hypothetical protein
MLLKICSSPFIFIVLSELFSSEVERDDFIKNTMADLEIGGPSGLLSAALQLPYTADPGTPLTEWLLRDIVKDPSGAVLTYADLPPLDAANLFDHS